MSKSKGNTVEPWQVLDTLRRRRVPLVLLHLQAALGRLSLLGGDDRRGRAAVPQAAVEHVLLLRALRARRRPSSWAARRRSRPAGGGPTTTSTAGRCRAPPARPQLGGRAPGRLRRDDAPGGRSPSSWTSCRTGTCAARAGASGTAIRPRFETLRTCLLTVAKLLAPFCPFIADEIYDNLDGALASVHLCDFPRAARRCRARDEELEQAMALARETVRLGLGARGKAKIKVRQPLGEAVVVADGREREAIERLADIVREELNVRRVRFVAAAEELGSYEVKANYRTLGPLFGKDMPLRGRGDRGARPGAGRRGACAHGDRGDRRSGRSGSRRRARAHALSRGRDPDDARRPRATASSARAPTRSRSTWRSTRTCARRAGRARSSTPCRTRARAPACRSRTGSSCALGGDPALIAGRRDAPRLPRRRDARGSSLD